MLNKLHSALSSPLLDKIPGTKALRDHTSNRVATTLRRHFNMIELTCIISVLAVGAVLVLPANGKGGPRGETMQDAAKRVACADNLRRQYMWTINYARSNDGQLPQSVLPNDLLDPEGDLMDRTPRYYQDMSHLNWRMKAMIENQGTEEMVRVDPHKKVVGKKHKGQERAGDFTRLEQQDLICPARDFTATKTDKSTYGISMYLAPGLKPGQDVQDQESSSFFDVSTAWKDTQFERVLGEPNETILIGDSRSITDTDAAGRVTGWYDPVISMPTTQARGAAFPHLFGRKQTIQGGGSIQLWEPQHLQTTSFVDDDAVRKRWGYGYYQQDTGKEEEELARVKKNRQRTNTTHPGTVQKRLEQLWRKAYDTFYVRGKTGDRGPKKLIPQKRR